MLTVVRGDRVRRVLLGASAGVRPAAAGHRGRDDALRARRRIEQALAPADLQPAGVPRGAIACVRRVRAMLPRRQSRWTEAIERDVGRLGGACRPFAEPVPATANIVFFVDEAELLACVARDWTRGADAAWWWPALFGDTPLATVVARELAVSPAFVPAVLDLLDRAGIGGETVGAMNDAWCARLAEQVAAAHAIAWTAPSLALRLRSGQAAGLAAPSAAAEPPAGRAAAAARDVDALETLAQVLHPFSGLSVAQRVLVALGLTLRRQPDVARSPAFAATLHQIAATVGPAADPRERVTPAGTVSLPAPAMNAGMQVTPSNQGGREADVAVTPPRVTRDAPLGQDASSIEARDDTRRSASAPAIAPAPAMALPAPEAVSSAVAGIFYLVNVALRCGFYSDFSNPLGRNLPLPLPDLLALVAARIYGPEIAHDGIWRVLAEMAGRNEEMPPRAHLALPDGAADEAAASAWLDAVIDTLAASVADATALGPTDALPFVCGQPGTIRLSPARLAVTFALAAHPIVLRLAGLDRNPGWVPSAGRVIEFHYE